MLKYTAENAYFYRYEALPGTDEDEPHLLDGRSHCSWCYFFTHLIAQYG